MSLKRFELEIIHGQATGKEVITYLRAVKRAESQQKILVWGLHPGQGMMHDVILNPIHLHCADEEPKA